MREEIQEATRPTLKQGAKVALVSAVIEGGTEFVSAIVRRRREGKQLEEFTEEDWLEVLKESGKTIRDIDYVICHQANERIIDHVNRKYPGLRFYKNIHQYANTSAASIPIALDEMYEKKLLRKGMNVILVGFGAGFTWSSALLTI